MSDEDPGPAAQAGQDTEDAAEAPARGPESDKEHATGHEDGEEDGNKRLWYRRPGPIIAIVILLLVLAVVLPPVVAAEVPVGLSDEGRQNAQAGGWAEEPGDGPVTAFIGLVIVDPTTLFRERNGVTDGVYVYSTVKIPLILPMGFVEGQMVDTAIELLRDNGVRVHEGPRSEGDYTENGHDVTLRYYSATAVNGQFFVLDTPVDLFIATWRCSLLGSYAVVIGAAAEPGMGGGFPFFGGQGQDSGASLEEVRDSLLPHTKCDP